jgi:hypothetical protein
MKKYLLINYFGYLSAGIINLLFYFLIAWSRYQGAFGYDPYLIIFETFIMGLPFLFRSALFFFVSMLFKRRIKKLESGIDLTILGGRLLKVVTVLEVILVIFFIGISFMMSQVYIGLGFY